MNFQTNTDEAFVVTFAGVDSAAGMGVSREQLDDKSVEDKVRDALEPTISVMHMQARVNSSSGEDRAFAGIRLCSGVPLSVYGCRW